MYVECVLQSIVCILFGLGLKFKVRGLIRNVVSFGFDGVFGYVYIHVQLAT